MEKRTAMIIIGSVLAIIIFLVGAYQLTNKQVVETFSQLNTLKPTDHIRWSKDKKITLIEYSDLECPACKAYHEFLTQIAKDPSITSRVTFIYRHFPLDTIHPRSRIAAYAAEAAGMQGKFYEMHDILFEKQDEWNASKDAQVNFLDYAKALKLNLDTFKKDMESKEVIARVQDDISSGAEVQVNATPTFYLNGTKLQNPRSADELKAILQQAIASSK